MKKIISIVVVAMLLATSLLVALPASAATKTLNVNWENLAYVAYNDNGREVDEVTFLNNFTVTKTATTFGVSRTTTTGNSVSYISTSQFAITENTSYTYEVMGKNNNTTKYSGIPFAIDADGNVYFIYGSFDNNNDSDNSQSGKSYVISAKADFDNKYPNATGDELDPIYFAVLKQTDGFASFKFEYEGLTVKIYAKDTNGEYIQMGTDVELPEGSKVAFGLFSRDATNGGNRTTTVKNAVITANNDAAVSNLIVESNNGAGDLRAEIIVVERDYPEVNYTAESYAALKTAIDTAKAVADDPDSTADEVSEALTNLQNAVFALVIKEADTTALEEAIAQAKKLKEVEYTVISYNMVMGAVDAAEELLASGAATQLDVNTATENILGRIAALQSSGIIAEPDEDEEADVEDGEENEENEENEDVDAPATDAPATDAPAIANKGGCTSTVAISALAIVGVIGTALVIKKRD